MNNEYVCGDMTKYSFLRCSHVGNDGRLRSNCDKCEYAVRVQGEADAEKKT